MTYKIQNVHLKCNIRGSFIQHHMLLRTGSLMLLIRFWVILALFPYDYNSAAHGMIMKGVNQLNLAFIADLHR